MNNLHKIRKILTLKENFYLKLIFFGIIICTFLEMISFAVIIPFFKVIFMEDQLNLPFLNSYFKNTLQSYNQKTLIIFFVLILFLIKNSTLIIFNFIITKFFNVLNVRVSSDLFRLYLDQGYTFFVNKENNNILRKLTVDSNGFKDHLFSKINLIIEVLFVFSLSILLAIINFQIFIILFIFFSIIIILYIASIKKNLQKWAIDFQKNNGLLQNIVNEGVNGIKDISIYNLQDRFLKKFKSFSEILHKSQIRIEFFNNIQRNWMELIAIAGTCGAVLYFIYKGINLSQLIPIFAIYSLAILRAIPSFNKILFFYQNSKYFQPSLDSVFNDFENLKFKKLEYSDSSKITKFESNIKLNDVTFRFKNRGKIFHNVNLTISKGDSILIKGQNGSGKSTFVNLISGLLNDYSGEILFDNKNYRNLKNIVGFFSYVQQDLFLLDDTIENNIILKIEEKTKNENKKRMELLNQMLHFDKYFNNLREGLNTLVGPSGKLLSGGQKQIISIARALFDDKKQIFIFDEPQSALDEFATENLENILNDLTKMGKTILVISHDDEFFKNGFTKKYIFKDQKIEVEEL